MGIGAADLERVRGMWRELTGVPTGFRVPGIEVADVAETRSAPPGAISIVVVGDSAVVAGPSVVARREAIEQLGREGLVERERVEPVLGPFAGTLGPAELWYGRPVVAQRHEVVGPLAVDHELVVALLAGASDDEIDESGVADAPSGAFVALDGDGRAAAGCGWHAWPHGIAHIGVLTDPLHRRQGYAASAAVVALSAASAAGLLPQWRAAVWNGPSIGLARRLGLSREGTQFSVLPR